MRGDTSRTPDDENLFSISLVCPEMDPAARLFAISCAFRVIFDGLPTEGESDQIIDSNDGRQVGNKGTLQEI